MTGTEIITDLLASLDRLDLSPAWTGFTVPWHVWGHLRATIKPDPLCPHLIGGMEVYVVSRQETDCLQWYDRKSMNQYIELMDKGNDVEGRLTILLELAEERDWPEFLEKGK